MIKLVKLCFVCCLIFRATFVGADYENYKKYIEELKELEERYKNVDKIIDLSGYTMREVVKQMHDILQLRVHNKIGTSQEQDSHPALLKVNNVTYELYFHGTDKQPGNCMLIREKGKPKAWMKEYKYNSELNTEENYVEQNLLFCLEIARRKLCCDSEGNTYDIFYDTPILEIIVIGLDLVNNEKECSTLSFFGCFDSNGRKNIADTFIKKAGFDDKTLGKLKLEFYTKRIDEMVIRMGCEQCFKNDLSCLVKNEKVVEILKKQNFTHCEPIEKLTPAVLDTANFSEEITSESVIEGINSLEFFSLAFNSDDGVYKESISKISEKLKPVYVLDGNAKYDFVKFLAPKNITRETKLAQKKIKEGEVDTVKFLRKDHFEKGFVFLHATGKDGNNRWFYLNKSNGTVYLLSETSKS